MTCKIQQPAVECDPPRCLINDTLRISPPKMRNERVCTVCIHYCDAKKIVILFKTRNHDVDPDARCRCRHAMVFRWYFFVALIKYVRKRDTLRQLLKIKNSAAEFPPNVTPVTTFLFRIFQPDFIISLKFNDKPPTHFYVFIF